MKKTHKGNARDILSRNLRIIRAHRDMQQDALAFEADMSQSYLSDVESGRRNISIDNIERLAKALGVEVWDLLNPALTAPAEGPLAAKTREKK